jgi:hypothetical protein
VKICKPVFIRLSVLLLAFACVAQTAQAQDFPSEADWKVSFYLWSMAVDGEVGIGPVNADVDLSFGDIFGAFNFGGALAFRRDWGRNVFVADLAYLSLSPDDVDTPLGGTISTDLDMPLLNFYYGRKFALGNGHAGWLVGARYMQMDTKVTWKPNLPMEPKIVKSDSPDFTDFLVGGFYESSIGEKWDMNLQGDIGMGGSNHSWNAQIMFLRNLQSGNSVTLGFKALDVDYDDDLPNGELFYFDSLMTGFTFGFMWD